MYTLLMESQQPISDQDSAAQSLPKSTKATTKTSPRSSKPFLTLAPSRIGLVIIVSVSVISLLAGGALAYSSYRSKQIIDDTASNNSSGGFGALNFNPLRTPSPAPTSTPTPSPVVETTASPSPKSEVTPTPQPTATPTPTPIPTTDLQVKRLGLQGTQSGSVSFAGPGPHQYTELPGAYKYYIVTEIINNGPLPAENYQVKLFNNQTLLQEKTYSLIQVGATQLVTLDIVNDLGTYQLRAEINLDDSMKDTNVQNNQLTSTNIIQAETEPPQISLAAERDNQNQQTCVDIWVTDNMSSEYEMKFEEKLDNENFHQIVYRPDPSSQERYQRCLSGPTGENHTYKLRVTDKRGNTAENTLDFELYSF